MADLIHRWVCLHGTCSVNRLISSHTSYRCRWFDFILTASAGPNVVLECDEIANREHLTYRMRFEGDRVAVEDQYHKYIIAKRK